MKCRGCGKECTDYGFGHCKKCCGAVECVCGHTEQAHIENNKSVECLYSYNCDCKEYEEKK